MASPDNTCKRCGNRIDCCTCRLKVGRSLGRHPPTAIARQALVTREEREFQDARSELAKVAPETAAIVEGWARLWRPGDAQ